MRKSNWIPSIVPNGMDQNIYLVLDRLDGDTTIFHERVLQSTDLDTVINDLLAGQYEDPLRVLSFNPDEKWSLDVSEDVAREIQKRCDLQLNDVPSTVEDFVHRHIGQRDRQLPLKLA
jgi:hypothetical protein